MYSTSTLKVYSPCTLKAEVFEMYFLLSSVPSLYLCRWAGLGVSSAVMGRSGAHWVWLLGTSMQLLLPLVLCVTCIHGLFPPQPRVFLSFQGKNGSYQTPVSTFPFRWGPLQVRSSECTKPDWGVYLSSIMSLCHCHELWMCNFGFENVFTIAKILRIGWRI